VYRLGAMRNVSHGTRLGVLPLNAPYYREASTGESLSAGGRSTGGKVAPKKPLPAPKSPVSTKPVTTKPKAPTIMPLAPVVISSTPKTPAAPVVIGSPQTALQAAQALLATNPGALTQAQFALLQQAGDISSNLPYSEAGSITPDASAANPAGNDPMCLSQGMFGGPYPNCVSVDPACAAAGMSGGPYPNCTALTTTSLLPDSISSVTDAIPVWGWVAGGVLVLYLATRKKGRR
jgi:hypothetical protein